MKKFLKILVTSFLLTVPGYTKLNSGTPIPEKLNSHLLLMEKEARKQNPAFKSFDAEKGRLLYFAERTHSVEGDVRSCVTCHTKNPSIGGQTTAGKPIDPLSPAVTRERFMDLEKLEKWFFRNCKWVLERECTSEEKGNFLAYLFSL